MNEFYMLEAIKEAKKSIKYGDIPVGAVIVKNNKIISRGYNKKEAKNISTKHAEIIAIEKACKKLKNWRLDECTIYVTMEPCIMCSGAIIHSRIPKLVYAVQNKKFGAVESIENIFLNKKNNHKVNIETNVLEKEVTKMLSEFFKNIRK